MNFSSNFFWKLDLIGFFRELNVRKFRKSSPDHFYDKKLQFYNKKTDFRPGMEITSETTIPGISSETTIPGISSETTTPNRSQTDPKPNSSRPQTDPELDLT